MRAYLDLLARILASSRSLNTESGGHVLVKEGGILLHGVADGKNGRQHLIVNFDEVKRLFGNMGIGGGHCGHGVTLIQHFFMG